MLHPKRQDFYAKIRLSDNVEYVGLNDCVLSGLRNYVSSKKVQRIAP